jgi:mannose-6-phosphate isomerase-like protein (cupin superfamily)
MKTARERIKPFITKDGSEIRELLHPAVHGNRKQSLAEARVLPGCVTRRHKHYQAEELYHILSGSGLMHLGSATFSVRSGDTVCILPGTSHCIENTEKHDLVFLCCCAPAYAHQDTELL